MEILKGWKIWKLDAEELCVGRRACVSESQLQPFLAWRRKGLFLWGEQKLANTCGPP